MHQLSAKFFRGNNYTVTLKANALLKRNIEALLRARGHRQRDLAEWCHRSEEWLSKALRDERRGLPVKYMDRMADFFGIAVYQLFQPGINSLTERRSGLERRQFRERRVGRGGLMREQPASNQAALVELISYLDEGEQADFVRMLGDRLRGRRRRPGDHIPLAEPASLGATMTPPPARRRSTKTTAV